MPADIVVDASIAHAAGEEGATFPDSKNARDCLKCIRGHRHSLVLFPELIDEWNRHQSRFASKWRTSMYARRLVRRIESPFDEQLRQRIRITADTHEGWSELEKDCLLVEAALVTDRIVISLDEAARNLFRKSAVKVTRLRDILWANPCRPNEEVEIWVSSGCPKEQNRSLEFRLHHSKPAVQY